MFALFTVFVFVLSPKPSLPFRGSKPKCDLCVCLCFVGTPCVPQNLAQGTSISPVLLPPSSSSALRRRRRRGGRLPLSSLSSALRRRRHRRRGCLGRFVSAFVLAALSSSSALRRRRLGIALDTRGCLELVVVVVACVRVFVVTERSWTRLLLWSCRWSS